MRTVIFGDLVEEGDNPNFVNDDYGAQVWTKCCISYSAKELSN